MFSTRRFKQALFCSIAIVIAPAHIVAAQQSWFSGEMRFEGLFKRDITQESGAIADPLSNDEYDLQRLRLIYNQLFYYNKYYAKFAITARETDVFQIKTNIANDLSQQSDVLLRLGEVSISVNHQGLVTTYGYINTPELSDEYDLFQLGIGPNVGTILGRSGYKLGARANVKQGPMGAQVGGWKQTNNQAPTSFTPVQESITPSQLSGATSATVTNLDSDEVAQSLTTSDYPSNNKFNLNGYAWGGRLAYMPYYNLHRSFGFGLGLRLAPLDTPLLMAVLYQQYQEPYIDASDAANDIPAQGFYRLLTFPRLQELRFDMLRTYDQFYIRLASNFQRLPVKEKVSVIVDDTSGGTPVGVSSDYFIFEDPGRSFGYYAEAAYVFGAKSYKVCRERSAIMGVRHLSPAGALEIGVRIGLERYTNSLALLQINGQQDFASSSYTTSSGTISGADRLLYESGTFMGNANYDYTLIAVNNVVDANTDFFITPETVDEHWFFGIGPTKKVIYSYKTAAQGLSLHLNYYYNENLRLQLQFQSTKYQKNIISRDNGMVDSINYQHIRDFRFMIEACY